MSTSADNIRNNLADSPDIDEDNTTRKLLEEDGDLASFRKLMRGEPCWYYNEWKFSAARQGANNWTDIWNESDWEKLEKLKSFELWAIADLGMRGNSLHHAVGYMGDGGESARTGLEPVWEGDSGDAARESLKKYVKACTDAAAAWEEFGHVTSSLCGDIKGAVQDLISWGSQGAPRNVYLDKYGGLNNDTEDDFLSDIRDVLSYVAECSGEISPGDSPAHIAHVIDTAFTFESTYEGWIKWLDDHNDAYSEAISAYRTQVDDTIQTIEGLLNTYGDNVRSPGYLADLNPLAAIRPAVKEKPVDKGKDKGGTDSSGSDSGGTGGTGSSGSDPGGTGSPSTGSPSTGSPSTGSPTATEPADTGQPAEGTNPVTGKPLEVDPATGKPYPIDPTTGEPIKDGGDDQDTITVKQGENEVTVTEPSKTGEMEVGVDDGKGGAKNYKLDFDPENNPKDGKGGDSVGGSAGGFGPPGSGKEGAAGGKGADPEHEVHTPDEDGKIRIKDGDVEIVAEQPLGPDGATVVTVDDGTGEPVTQILGDQEDVDEFKRRLAADEARLSGYREELEGRENVSKQEWDELKKEEQSFRERGGHLPDEDGKHAEKVGGGKESGEERSPARSVFDEAEREDKSSGIGKSAFDDGPKGGGGAGVGGGASGMSAGGAGVGGTASSFGGGGGGEAAGVGGSAQQLDPGARSGVGAPAAGGPAGGAGVGTAPGGSGEPAAAGTGARGGMGGGMMGGGMMGGGAGGGGGDEARTTNAAYQVHGGLFEPEVAEGPFGVARISGSLDDEE